jgi:hypothetical protein
VQAQTTLDAASLFGERPGDVVVGAADPDAALGLAQKHGLAARVLGTFGGKGLILGSTESRIEWTDEELRDAYEGAIPRLMEAGGDVHDRA